MLYTPRSDGKSRSEKYRQSLRAIALDRLSGVSCVVSGHQFLINDETAQIMAESLATKRPNLMQKVLGSSINNAAREVMEAPISTYVEEWDEAVASSFDKTIRLADIVTSDDELVIHKMRSELQRSRQHQFGLETDAYVRMLQAIAFASLPENGYEPRHTTNQRIRRKDTPDGLFATAMRTLDDMATQEPGLGILREDIRSETVDNPIDGYISRLQKCEMAKEALASVISLTDKDEIAAVRKKTIDELSAETTEDAAELLAHILTWEILPHDLDKPDAIKNKLKKKAKDSFKDGDAEFEKKWESRRLDVLLNIARQEAVKGRHVEVFISSVFGNSQEFYVAVEFNNPASTLTKLVIADNPMSENAIYMVDEEHTETDERGIRYGWREVLGANKKIARRRGAKRRYHAGNWEQHSLEFCVKGQKTVGRAARKAAGIVTDQEKPEFIEPTVGQDELPTKEAQIIKEASTAPRDDVLKRIDDVVAYFAKLSKQIIDKE